MLNVGMPWGVCPLLLGLGSGDIFSIFNLASLNAHSKPILWVSETLVR